MAPEKKVLQDMVTNKDSGMVRSSSFTNKTDPSAFFARRKQTSEQTSIPSSFSSFIPNSSNKKLWYILGAVGLVVFIAGVYLIGNIFFSEAKVLIVQKQQVQAVDTTIVAKKDIADTNELSFKLVSIEEHTQKEIPASGSKFIERKASGQIIVYNNYSTESQRFVKNTRFQTADGKIYRINNAIIVPGTKVVAGKTVPGSVETTVFADQPGSQYNIALSDFTLPGLKDGEAARYKGFYARSKTPITGGISGEMVIPSPDELEKARILMDKELTDKLTSEIASKIPQGYILFKSLTAATFSLDQDNQNAVEKGKASKTYTAKETGVLTGVLFDLNMLSQYLAKRTIPGFSGESVTLASLSDLVVTPTTPLSDALPDKDFSFRIHGNARFLWNVDKISLRSDLKGIPLLEKSQEAVFKKYPSIIKADVDVKPFWRRNFPDDPEKIIIESTTTPDTSSDK